MASWFRPQAIDDLLHELHMDEETASGPHAE